MVKHQRLFQHGALLAVLVVLIAVFSSLSDRFFQLSTFTTIANQNAGLILVSVGMTLVLVVGGIDLSVGSVLAVSAMTMCVLNQDHQWSAWITIPCCLLVGAACGLFNGSVSVLARIPSFIVTLGMLEIARGATVMMSNSQTKAVDRTVEVLGEPLGWMVLSPAFLLALAMVAAGQFLLSQTVFGRYCVAIGTNAEAVRMSGIRTEPYTILVFVICGLLCALAGLAISSRITFADPNAGAGMELSAIAACVIGGTSLMGGRGNVVSSFLGVWIIAVMQTGLAQIGASEPTKQIVTGAVIIVAVFLDALRIRYSKSERAG